MTSWWQGVPSALFWTGASDPATWSEVERYTLDAVLARQQTERQSFGGSPVATAYAQNAAHFPTRVGAESRTVHHGFLNGDGNFYYRWDAWGRLTEVRDAATGLVRRSHLYDAEGRRVLETEVESGSPKTTRYVYWGRGLAASYDLAGGNTRTYGFVGAADGESFVRMQQGGSDERFELARDFQGSILALIQRTNPSQVSVAERYRYEPFGKVSIEDGSGQSLSQSAFGNERFFLGRVWDAELRLYDVRARWYEPDVGGFLSPDPLGAFDSWNFYQYGLAEPNSVFDPSGLQRFDIQLKEFQSWPETPKPVEPPPHPMDEGADWANTPEPSSDAPGGIGLGDVAGAGLEYGYYEAFGDAQVALCFGFDFYEWEWVGVKGWLWAVLSTALPGSAGGAARAAEKLSDAAKAGGKAAREGTKVGAKIARQMESRGWTQEAIEEAINSGQQVKGVNKASGNAATRYVHPTTGQSVVVDNVTGEVIHIGGPGFKYGPGSGDLP